MPRHGSREDEISRSLLPEDFPRNTCAVIRARKVDIHHLVPVLQLVVQPASLRRDARIRDHNVQTAKVFEDRVRGSLDLGTIR